MNSKVYINENQDTIVLFDKETNTQFQLFLLNNDNFVIIAGAMKNGTQDSMQTVIHELHHYTENQDTQFTEFAETLFKSYGFQYYGRYVFSANHVKSQLNNGLNKSVELVCHYTNGNTSSILIQPIKSKNEVFLWELNNNRCGGGITVDVESVNKLFELINLRYDTNIGITM